MSVRKELWFQNEYQEVFLDEPSECPICKYAIAPQQLYLDTYADETYEWFVTGLYLCKHCYQTFVCLYSCEKDYCGCRTSSTNLVYCEPNRFKQRDFPKEIEEISPKFVEIYNQSKSAEQSGLNEICGMGYRKALEFLIKDYLIHRNPESADSIKDMDLANCIANKITDEDIKITASRCAWLGNDHAHYIHRFEEFDLDILKQLLEATVYWVSMKLTTKFAASIQKRFKST